MVVPNIKCVFLDWNQTLSYSLFWEHLKDPNHDNHHLLDTIERWLFQKHRDLINPWMLGQFSTEYITDRLSNDLAIEPQTVFHELQESCERMTFCSADILPMVKKIRKSGVRVVIATDNMDTFGRFTVPALKLDSLFDDVLSSNELKVMKDDAEPLDGISFFDAYLRKHDLSYSSVLLLDDSPDMTGKYARLGFNRVLISSPDQLIQELEKLA